MAKQAVVPPELNIPPSDHTVEVSVICFERADIEAAADFLEIDLAKIPPFPGAFMDGAFWVRRVCR